MESIRMNLGLGLINGEDLSSKLPQIEETTRGLIPRYRIFIDGTKYKVLPSLPKNNVIVVYRKGKIVKVDLGKKISRTKWDDTSKYKYAEIQLGKGSKALAGIIENLTNKPYFLGVTTSKGMDAFYDIMKFLSTSHIKMPKDLEKFLNSYKEQGYNCLFDTKDLESNILNIYATVDDEKISEESKLNLSQIKEILKYSSEVKIHRVLNDTLEIKYVSAFQPSSYDVKFTITGMSKFREYLDNKQLDKKANKKDLAILKVIEATNKNKEF